MFIYNLNIVCTNFVARSTLGEDIKGRLFSLCARVFRCMPRVLLHAHVFRSIPAHFISKFAEWKPNIKTIQRISFVLHQI